MLQFLNKTIKNNPLKRSLFKIDNNQGQVGVVIILILAVVLIFYAVTLNLGRVAEKRTSTTIASNTGASILASQMASYGQALFMQTLGGKKKYCDSTGLLGLIIGLILIVVLIATGQIQFTVLVAIGLALTTLAIILQIAVIQPGITDAWNKMTSRVLSREEQFIEQGIRAGLRNAVTDNELVPDVYDDDLDRVWGFDASGQPKDKLNRFGFYYTALLRTITINSIPEIGDFKDALKDFVYEDQDTWGLYDPYTCPGHPCCYDPVANPSIPSECNPCCVPKTITDPLGGGQIDIRPTCCDTGNPATECGVSTTCLDQSPYGDPTYFGDNYRFVFDPYYEDRTNAFLSFRELLGRDDEHIYYRKDPDNPNGKQFPVIAGTEGFILDDATGYYVNPPFTPLIPDNRVGIFTFLHKLKEWGTDLSSLTTNNPFNPQCAWCDPRGGTFCNMFQPPELPQLTLPIDPATLSYDNSYCVDSTTDKIPMPKDIVADDDVCAQFTIYPNYDATKGFWKSGGDRYCAGGDSTGNWPYFANCPKHKPFQCTDPTGTINTICECNEPPADPMEFPDDALDDIIYKIPDFIQDAQRILAKSTNKLILDFKLWYPDIATWIEPGPPATQSTTPPCYVCSSEPGGLYIWRNQINEMANRFQKWKEKTSYEGLTCSDVWCVPSAGCSAVPPEERALFDSNSNGVRGDLVDVVACLNYNVEGYDFSTGTVKPVGTNEGNDFRFQQCRNTCSAADCSNLPRSVIPTGTYDPQAYVPGNIADEPDIAAMLACYDSCSNATCQAMPPAQSSTGSLYPYPDPSTFDATVDCTGTRPNNTNGFLTGIQNALLQAGPSCDLTSSTGWLALTGQSALEAKNQVAKFKQRRDFLSTRIAEVDNAITILRDAEAEFSNFLAGPAADLIQARIDLDAAPPSSSGFPYHAIYGWQSPSPDPVTRPEGYWHIVKVEGRLPGQCDTACGLGQAPGSDPEWPRVITYTKKMGTKRCYELINTEGVVKFRVTRFDEDTEGKRLFFPNGLPIWKFRFFLPSRRPADVTGLRAVCRDIIVSDPPVLPAGQSNIYEGAFIMNKRIGTSPTDPVQGNNYDCWNHAQQILADGGVTSQTCAEYYYHDGMRQGLSFRFIPCKNF